MTHRFYTFATHRILSLFALLIVVALPITAYAGLLSLVFKTSHNDFSIVIPQNSQTQSMGLLAASGVVLLGGQGGPAELIIDSGEALVPQISPLGENRGTQIEDVKLVDQQNLYVVREGDTLGHIAEIFGVSSQTIRIANDISAKSIIRPGDQLEIPPVDGLKHIVKSGESLGVLADRYNVGIDVIQEANFILDTKLVVGQNLFIPGATVVPKSSAPVVEKKQSPNLEKPVLLAQETKKSSAGKYIRPVEGPVTQWFHGPKQALDIGGPVGKPILAMADGIITAAKSPQNWNGGYGGMVDVYHKQFGTKTRYAHLSEVSVSVGQKVVQGQIVGRLGNTGRSTGPHLHYEVFGVNGPVPTPILYSRP